MRETFIEEWLHRKIYLDAILRVIGGVLLALVGAPIVWAVFISVRVIFEIYTQDILGAGLSVVVANLFAAGVVAGLFWIDQRLDSLLTGREPFTQNAHSKPPENASPPSGSDFAEKENAAHGFLSKPPDRIVERESASGFFLESKDNPQNPVSRFLMGNALNLRRRPYTSVWGYKHPTDFAITLFLFFFVLLGTRLIVWAIQLERAGIRKFRLNIHTWALVLSLLHASRGRVSCDEIAQRIPTASIPTLTEEFDLIDGVLYLRRSQPPGLALTDDLRNKITDMLVRKSG